MSQLNTLLQRLCPDGVEYKQLGELGNFYGGITGKSKNDFKDGNEIFITYKNVYSNPSLNINPYDRVKIGVNEKQRTLEYGDVIFTGSSETPDECGFSSVVCEKPTEKLYLNSFCFIFRFKDLSIIEPQFAKHLFRSSNLRYQIGKTASGVTRFNVSKKLMENIIIPLPPLPVQEEIVRILDTFSQLIAELKAELKARKKQYEYYRDKLINTAVNSKFLYLYDVAKIKNGKDYKHMPSGEYPVYGSGGIISHTSEFAYNKPSVLIPRKGSLNNLFYIDKPFWNVDTIFYTEINDRIVIPKYLYYILENEHLEDLNIAGGVPSLTQTVLNQIKIPLPSMNEQEKIVSILDRFDTLCNDLTQGIPAEIEARQKQYEYYRDKLLTFRKKEI